MANLNDEIQSIVEEVMRNPEIAALLKVQDSVHRSSIAAVANTQSDSTPLQNPAGAGIFLDLDSAVAAAKIAQRELIALPLDTRRAIIEAMRRVVLWNNADLSAQAVAETGIGNVEDKQVKNKLAAMKTPGVEDLEPRVSTDEHEIGRAHV